MRKLTGWSVRAASGKYGGPLRQQRDELVAQRVDAVAGDRADRMERVEVAEPRDLRDALGDRRRCESVDLVEGDHGGPLAAEHARRDEPVARPGLAGRVEHQQHGIHVGEALVDGALHALGQRVARPLEARKVGEHELRAGNVDDAQEAAPGRLRLVRHDRDVVAAERVRQRRLADVRTAGQPHEPAAERGLLESGPAVVGLLVHARRAEEAASGSNTSSVSTTSSPSYRCTTGMAGANSAST